MFSRLSSLPPDPILGLIAQFKRDSRPSKIDLGVGVYRNAEGQTPILSAVKQAEKRVFEQEVSKAYIGPTGNPAFNAAMVDLVLGKGHAQRDRMALVQTPGGCGALRVAAELVKRADSGAVIWVSDPTWGNHQPLLGNAGIQLRAYPYYDFTHHRIDFESMMSVLSEVKKGDLVLLHGCCHNPCGADLSASQWQVVSDLANQIGFIPFVDMAYQGLGVDLDTDAYGIRLLCDQVSEVLLAVSCSKNFGLYCERVGAVALVSDAKQAAESHIASIVRGIYSMPPNHGAAIVADILLDQRLRNLWVNEVAEMRDRMTLMRQLLVDRVNELGADGRFNHIAHQQGMFSFVGLSERQVSKLAEDFAIYMVSTSRISIAGLNPSNLGRCAEALMEVIKKF